MFRLRDLWQSSIPPNEEFSPDATTSFELENTPIVVSGSFSGTLRFYFPSKADKGLPFTEIKIKNPILQLKYGVFLKAEQYCLAVLQPKLITLYNLQIKDKTMVMDEIQSFILSHSAYNFIATQIDGLTSPPSIIVQSLDGNLTIITANAADTYPIPHFFLPGPFCYIPLLESFIFAAADYKVICYRKNVIFAKQAAEANEDWSYVIGEQVIAIHYWKKNVKHAGASNFDIAIVGERTLCVLTDSGKLKTLMKHNGNCICSHAYSSQPDSNKTCNNLMIGCEDKTISIYINFKKVWQLSINFIPINLGIINIPPNNGLLSIMNAEGTILIGYLGTHESGDLGLPKLPRITKEQLKDHMNKVNERISQIPTSDHLQLFVNVSRASPSMIELVFQSNQPELKNVRCFADLPLSINRVEPIKVGNMTQEEQAFRMQLTTSNAPPGYLTATLNAMFETSEARTLSKSVKFDIPFELFIQRCEPRVKLGCTAIVYAKDEFLSLVQIFSNFVLPEKHSFSFVLTNGDIISLSEDSKAKRYRVEAETFDKLGFAILILMKAYKSSLKFKDPIQINLFNEIVSEHHKLRVIERSLKKELHEQVQELEHVQKALIARYEAATPESLDDLTDLLNKTTSNLKETSKKIEENQRELERMDGRIEAAVTTLVTLINLSKEFDQNKAEMIANAIPRRAQNCTPGWEECAYAGISYLLESFTGSKQSAAFGAEAEFLANVESLTSLFNDLIDKICK